MDQYRTQPATFVTVAADHCPEQYRLEAGRWEPGDYIACDACRPEWSRKTRWHLVTDAMPAPVIVGMRTW